MSALKTYIYSNSIEKSNCTEEDHDLIDKIIHNFCKRLSVMWKECHRVLKRFDQKYKVLEDLMNSLLISSDPLITSLSKSPSRHSNNDIFLDMEVKNLLCNAFDE